MARGTELEAPSFFHDLVEERPEEKILFHIQKSIPRQKRKRNTAKDFSGGRTAGTTVEAEGGAYRVTTRSERTRKSQATTRSARAKSVASRLEESSDFII